MNFAGRKRKYWKRREDEIVEKQETWPSTCSNVINQGIT